MAPHAHQLGPTPINVLLLRPVKAKALNQGKAKARVPPTLILQAKAKRAKKAKKARRVKRVQTPKATRAKKDRRLLSCKDSSLHDVSWCSCELCELARDGF